LTDIPADKRKLTLYFPQEMLDEIERECKRLDRPFSWIVQRAWRIARAELKNNEKSKP
jgi:uncharacterized small protein (TIGR04563 family)